MSHMFYFKVVNSKDETIGLESYSRITSFFPNFDSQGNARILIPFHEYMKIWNAHYEKDGSIKEYFI